MSIPNKTENKVDAKAGFGAATPATRARIAHRAAKKGKVDGKNAMVVDVILWRRYNMIGVNGTDNTTVQSLVPADCTEWTSWGALFDAARCNKVTVYTAFQSTGTPTTGTAVGVEAFDPGNTGALSSVVNGLEAKYHVGPQLLANLYGASAQTSSCPTGFHKWSAKTTPMLESGLTADLVGGNWYPTVSTTAIIGYLKPFAETVGGAVACSVFNYVGYHMTFAYRT